MMGAAPPALLLLCAAASAPAAVLPAEWPRAYAMVQYRISACPVVTAARGSACIALRSATEGEIRQAIIAEGIARHPGSCACPFSSDRAGRRCGRRSAYGRPEGESPLCFPEGITDAMVAAYRNRR